MNRILVLMALVWVSVGNLTAQRGHALTLGGGVAYYYGDLSDQFNNVFLRPSVTIQYGNYINPALSFRVGLTRSTVGAADSMAESRGRIARDLHFRNDITELSLLLYYEVLPDKRFGYYYRNKPHFTPYFFAGVALFGHSPKAYYRGEWHALQALGTEGQSFTQVAGTGRPYSLLQTAIPFGGGISFRFGNYTALNIDVSYRKLFTDYLDDVSTVYPDKEDLLARNGELALYFSDPTGNFAQGEKRGSPSAPDSYMIAQATLSFYLESTKKKR
ncbi:MAG: DUF6089 family protein [Bacteroidia bacterium]